MKHKTLRTLLCVILTVCFCLSAIVPASAAGLFGGDSGAATGWDQLIRGLKDRFTEKNPGTDETPADPMAGTGADGFYRIVHLDCGRKYFSVENIKKLIDTMAQYGYNQLQLAFGNDGFRFLLDDMELNIKNGISMLSDAVKSNITNGNYAYNQDSRYLNQDEMDAIIAYAGTKSIEIVPMINMPGHAKAIVYNTGYASNNNLNVSNETARDYGYALLSKYVNYFKNQGCRFFHFGSDESGYTGTDMTTFLTGCAKVITDAGMTPRAFNDATAVADMPESVQVTYWHKENGSKYANVLAQSHDLINTHGRWYYVIKAAQNSEIGTKYWQGTVNTTPVSVELPIMKATEMDNGTWVGLNEFFDGNPGYGSTISNNKGTMFCIWCDASQDAYLTDSDVISENENYGALYQLKKLAEHYWADDINKNPVDPVNPTEKVVNIKVGESVTYDVGETNVGEYAVEANVATANVIAGQAQAAGYNKVTKLINDRAYMIANARENLLLTNVNNVKYEGNAALKLSGSPSANPADSAKWIITVNNAYGDEFTGYVRDGNNKYLEIGNLGAGLVGTTRDLTLTYDETYAVWTIAQMVGSTPYFLNQLGGYGSKVAGGFTDGVADEGSRWNIYEITEATSGENTLTITGTGEGTTIVTIGGIKYTINVTASDVTETKRLTYGGSFALPTGAVVTEAPTSGVTVANGKVTAGDADAEVTVKAETKNAGGYVTKRYIYNVTVSNVDLSGVDPLSVELWVTNRYAGGTHNGVTYPATAAGHFVTVSAESAYGADGVLLEDLVPTRGVDERNLPLLFWKGTRLAYENRQEYTGNDKTGSGNDFLRVRYYENSWQYYSNSAWNAVLSTDQIIAYYMQVYNTSPEIVTAFRDYGGIAGDGGGEYDASWFAGYRGVATAVVYSDKSMSPDGDDGIWNNTLICYYEGASGGGTPGLIKVFDTDEFKITKITITKGVHKDSTGATGADATKTWNRTTSSVAWDKTVNDAGDEWYDETLIWDREKDYTGGTIQLGDTIWGDKWKTSGIGEAFLLLFYVEPVQKDENLNVVYWDDNASTQINPTDITISVKRGVTFLNIQQTSAVNTGTFVLDDDATIENSVGVQRKFNKNITIIEGVAANYRSGIYEYRSADISDDGKTLTLHYNLKAVADKHTYVVDFGLPLTFTDILSSFFGIIEADTVEYLSVAKSNVLTESTGSFGSVVIDTVGKTDGEGNPTPPYDTMTYTLDQKKTVSAPIYIPLYLKISGTTELQSTQIELIPATNVYYEETFTSTNANGNWSLVGTANDVEQTCDENVSGTPGGDIYGFDTNIHDSHYNKDAIGNNTTLKALTYSNGQAYKATLSLPEGKKNVMTSATVDFTFKGTGFDLISECGNDTGILLVTIDSRSKTDGVANVSKGYLVDTYFCGDTNGTMSIGDYLWQVPVVRDLKLPYDTYDVKVYGIVTKSSGVAVGPVAETAALAMDISDGSTSDLIADILTDCGISNLSVDDVEVIYMDENSVLNGGTGTAPSDIIRDKVSIQSVAEINAVTYPVVANCYVDGFRVYGALGNTETVSVDAYTNDKENEVKYMSIWDAAAKSLMTGTYYVEYKGTVGTDTVAIADYKNNGPENEIYLAKGQSIAFAINKWGTNYKLDVSAKVVKGNPELNANTLVNATEMYYSVTPVQTGNIFVVYLANNTDGVLAVSGLKMSKDLNIVEGPKATEAIVEVLSRMYAGNAFNPETFNVSAPETARKNRNFTINATVTAADVAMLTIKVDDGEEEVLEPYNTMYVENGYTDDYAYSKTYRLKKAGTYTFVVTAYDAAGNSVSLTRTVVVK